MDKLDEVKQLQASMQAKHAGAATMTYIEDEYRKASKRLIFLDYDGTLVGFKSNINQAFPDDDLYEILDELINEPQNHVVIVSGRNHETLEDWFGHLKIDIIAEHGAWQKHIGGEWTKLAGLSDQWKQDLMPMLETYVDRTPGSFIEEKSYSLVWHYRKVEEGLGELRANELMSNMRFLTDDKSLQMMSGNKVIEIKNAEVNKGKVASWLDKDEYDYILALGDDHTDEDMFKALPADAYTIKIGSNISAARFYMRDYKEVRKLLRTLSAKEEV